MTVGGLIKKLQKLPKTMTVLKKGSEDSDYPYVGITSVEEEKMLVNGDDIQLDTGDREPGEFESRKTAIVID